jgi:pyruvate formate lyase activating enzyme
MSLADELDRLTKPGGLAIQEDNQAVRCQACAHNCKISEGKRGVCKVRFNHQGELLVPWGYVSSLQVDPIEKKPFYHFLAGSDALTFGMLGCNFKCDYCQNWLTSQALKEEASERLTGYVREITSQEIINIGVHHGAEVVASSYNEPLITSEWAKDIFQKAGQAGIKQVYVSNGFASREVIDYLIPDLQGFKVDLKTMQEDHYRKLGGKLGPVLDSIQYAHKLGLWVEIVTLVVPGFNDTLEELKDLATEIHSVSPNIPWHVSAFRPDYKMIDRPRTPADQILKAIEIGYDVGLRYVYGGNLPGGVGEFENTVCHQCQAMLIKRTGYMIHKYRITPEGTCPECGTQIPGIWTQNPNQVKTSFGGFPRMV